MMLNKRLLSAAIRSALAVSLLSLAGLSVASAQDATTPDSSNVKSDSKASPTVMLKEVTVTGSRIPGVDLETQQPIFTMTQEDIKKTGLTDVGDIVQQMTTMSLPGFNKSSVLNGAGGSFVNMRNLGSQRVLVLVNGKRWISGIGGATDVSNIPAALIERVEVLKDGASAVYGSDAISGVINFILKDRFEGSQFNAYYGENQGGDAQTTQYSFTTGAKSDKGSIVFNANYNKRGVVWANSRPMTNYAYSPKHPNGTNEAGPWGLIYNSPMNPGQYLMLNHTGTQSSDPRDPANYHVYTGDPADEFNFTSQKMYQMPTELNSIFTHAMYNITDKITAKMSAMYSARTSSDQIAGNPLNYNSQRNYPVYVDGQSYYNPFPGTDLKWNRMMTEIPPQYTDKYKSYHLDGSVDGYFDLGEHEWNWSVGFNYNHGEGVTQGTGEWNLLALKKALGPSFLNGDGVVQCGTSAAPIPLGTSYQLGQCTPVSILAGPGNIPANGLAYILAPSTDTFGSTDRSYNADINGTLFDLPAGGLGFAAGVESRELSGYSR
ncbi:MAG: TonB-dependent receptor plug domain-containing protein, partial [Halothiobacillus sp.]|nr:TonB-dependent receptor plug domain-containing protein [Halothiobacillus sp.]